MKTLAAFALVLVALAPAAAAQTAASFTGKWEGSFEMTLPDGSLDKEPIELNLVQKDKVLTGTAGPGAERQWAISKGAVDAGKAIFEVQQPNGPLFSFTLTIVKGRLQGEMSGESGGQKLTAKVDAAKTTPK